MPEAELGPPIPVLVVGSGAEDVARRLGSTLSNSPEAALYSCAAFDTPRQAADASVGASHLVLIAIGPDCASILEDPAWMAWTAPGTQLAGIAITDQPIDDSVTRGFEIHRISPDHIDSLPILVRLAARLQ